MLPLPCPSSVEPRSGSFSHRSGGPFSKAGVSKQRGGGGGAAALAAPVATAAPAPPAALAVLAALMAVSLAACSPTTRSGTSPQSMMTHVAKQAQTCWFVKQDPAFKGYKLAPELNSFSGKPRILIVPSNNPGGLPKLVAQAERQAGQTQFTTFGPLLSSADGPRLDASLRAWSRGSKTC